MNDYERRAMIETEDKYTFLQSSQISAQTGLIGHLRADMDTDGNGFFSSWDDFRQDLKTDDFKKEFDDVINSLREEGDILYNRKALANYCYSNPQSAMRMAQGWYGVRVDTKSYTYLMRLNPNRGEYNLYCYCYVRAWLDQHMHRAEHGIRFITPDYQEIFRIPDGDRIRIFTRSGEMRDRVCRYIDDFHMETTDGFSTILYHIAEFAERSEQTGATVIPLRSSLPEKCFSVSEYSNDLIEVTKGVSGYSHAGKDLGALTPREAADRLNRELGVTKAQEQAMVAGSMFGWATPAADPANYNAEGKAIKPKQHDRGGAR